MSEFCTRDPIHGWITLPQKVVPIIDSPFFQRLYHIKQTFSAELVYTGATHTRGAHSLGVAYLAKLYANHLFPDDEEIEILLVCAGLLHDIGHGPFSHIWDNAIYPKVITKKPEGLKTSGHDQQRFRIVEYMKDIIDPIIPSYLILNIWRQNCNLSSLFNDIIQGPLGADRMDFILRDAYYSGTTHFGTISADRIINNSLISDGNLCFHHKVLGDITNTLRSRIYMYRNVYLHRTSVAGSILLGKAIEQAIQEDELNLIERTRDLSKFIHLTDAVLFEMVNSDNFYAIRYVTRKLPKMKWEGYNITTIPELKDDDMIYSHKQAKDYPIDKLNKMLKIWDGKSFVSYSDALKKYHYTIEEDVRIDRIYSM